MIGHRLGVIAGRHGDHAAAALVGGECGELHAGAAFLERVGDLQILVFHEHVGAGQRRQRRRRQYRRAQHMARDRAPGSLDIGKRHHARPFSLFPPALQCQSRQAKVVMAYSEPNPGSSSGPSGIGISGRPAAARLRSDCQSGTVRRRAGAPLRRLRHRLDHYCATGRCRGIVHLRVRPHHLRLRLDAVLAAVAGLGDLGAVLLWHDARQPGFGHARHARHGDRNAHLVRRAGLFRARRRARDRLLDQRQRAHAVYCRGRLLQRPKTAPARYPGRHRRYQQRRRGQRLCALRRGAILELAFDAPAFSGNLRGGRTVPGFRKPMGQSAT